MDTQNLVVQCDHCNADMDLVTGRTCFAERYERYECYRCGNAVETAVAAAQAVQTKQAA
jgi:DNA-directed RNA polymerase subunit RPC12/RpoP